MPVDIAGREHAVRLVQTDVIIRLRPHTAGREVAVDEHDPIGRGEIAARGKQRIQARDPGADDAQRAAFARHRAGCCVVPCSACAHTSKPVCVNPGPCGFGPGTTVYTPSLALDLRGRVPGPSRSVLHNLEHVFSSGANRCSRPATRPS